VKRVVFVPDLQYPFHNKRQVNSLAGFIRAMTPDDTIQVGDLPDFVSLGRWVRGRRGEYDHNIREHVDGVKKLIEKLRIKHWKRGNHDERLDKYVEENAPALRGFPGLSIEEAFDLENLGCLYHRGLYEFTPGWVVAHGDEGPTSKFAGGTAASLAAKVGKSVVCGHTHKAGIIPTTESFNGVPTRTLFGVEVGNMMAMEKASYLKGQYANWQSAFGVVDISNSSVQPYLVYMSQTGSFQFEGRSWEDGRIRKGSTK
jgi:hypothetical protein